MRACFAAVHKSFPKAAGIRALLPEVSLHLPAHNLASLQALAQLLSSPCN